MKGTTLDDGVEIKGNFGVSEGIGPVFERVPRLQNESFNDGVAKVSHFEILTYPLRSICYRVTSNVSWTICLPRLYRVKRYRFGRVR